MVKLFTLCMMRQCGKRYQVNQCSLHLGRGCLVGLGNLGGGQLMNLPPGVASLEDHAQSDVLIAKRLATTKALAKELLLEALKGGNGSTMRGRGRSQDANVGDPTGASTRGRGIVIRGRGRSTSASTRGRGTFGGTRGRGRNAGTRGRGRNAGTSGSGTNAGTSGIGTYAAIINSQSTGGGVGADIGPTQWSMT
ncbi:hypothetical protein RHMOL_Rhmol06G0151400 [Rhododendron molle]|uniref:Uncharacterized protein n=1 Tax=Rhododendron molle TaxID=49168 RepID=A0ACC0NEH9_RHOML|nr:hypothetical protein RHMOL_Rhmol06G0151400 [Rhododendron molle]